MSKKRGRPPLSPNDYSVRLSVRVPSELFDEACKTAAKHRSTLPATVRQAIRQYVGTGTSTN